MDVIVTNNPSGLRIKLNLGVDDSTGKTIVKSKTYSNIKHDAEDQDVFDIGKVIVSLQKHSLVEIARIDNSTLSA